MTSKSQRRMSPHHTRPLASCLPPISRDVLALDHTHDEPCVDNIHDRNRLGRCGLWEQGLVCDLIIHPNQTHVSVSIIQQATKRHHPCVDATPEDPP